MEENRERERAMAIDGGEKGMETETEKKSEVNLGERE